jgi:predicted RNA binding protein YcfA (HicA-like mRNA interferase family)
MYDSPEVLMTKHSKRSKKAHNNPKGVSYSDFISILDNEGYTVRTGKGSHRKAERIIGTTTFSLIFVIPHEHINL